jgi:hypothetical protein
MSVLGPIDADAWRLILPRSGVETRVGEWRPGQLVSARVIEILTAGRVILEIGQRQLEAETRVPLRAGQVIEARVAETGDKVVLQLAKDFHPERTGLEDTGRHFLARREELIGALKRLAEGTEAPERPSRADQAPDPGQPSPRAAAGRLLLETVLGPERMTQGRYLARELAQVGAALPRDEAAELARAVRLTLIRGDGPEAVSRLVRAALTRAGLPPGEVESKVTRLAAALADGSANDPGQVVRAAVRLLGLGPEMLAVRAARDLAARSESTPNPAGLKARLGEMTAADLRSELARLGNLPGVRSGGEESALIETVRTGLQAQQAVTHQVFTQDGALLFFLPQAWGGRWSLIELFVKRDGSGDKKEGETPGTNVVLFLDMSALGPVRVDARVRARALSVRFTLGEEEAAQALRRDFADLMSDMEALGFEVEFMGAFVRTRDEVEAASPLAEVLTGRDSGFHVVI